MVSGGRLALQLETESGSEGGERGRRARRGAWVGRPGTPFFPLLSIAYPEFSGESDPVEACVMRSSAPDRPVSTSNRRTCLMSKRTHPRRN